MKKINVDVEWNAQTKVASSGAIVRDHEGMVLADYACSITEAFDAPSAKAIASACTA